MGDYYLTDADDESNDEAAKDFGSDDNLKFYEYCDIYLFLRNEGGVNVSLKNFKKLNNYILSRISGKLQEHDSCAILAFSKAVTSDLSQKYQACKKTIALLTPSILGG